MRKVRKLEYPEEKGEGMKRCAELDYAKGIGIILVMLGHSITNMDNPLNTMILSFHMPLFFFLSGIVIKQDYTVVQYVLKRIRTIGMPLFTGFFIYNIVGIIVEVVWLKNKNFVNFNYLQGLDSWFLISLFIASIISFLLVKAGSKCSAVGGAIALMLFMKTSFGAINGLKYIEQSLLAILFLLLGYYMGAKSIVYLRKRQGKNGYVFTMLLLLLTVFSQINGPCAMAANIYGNKVLFILTSLIGICIVMIVVTSGIRSELLEFCGRNSIVIFVTHFGVQKLLINIWGKTVTYSYTNFPLYMIMFVMLFTIEIFVALLLSKYCPFLFGMRNVAKTDI